MATVQYAKATRRFDAGSAPAVDELDLDIADGEFLVLVGPSGCGKSTSLRMLAGLEPTDGGDIFIDGHSMAGVRPRDRDVAMVFQTYALYPNMTVAENMGFALSNAKMPKAEITARVQEAARILELEPLLDRKPAKLSGGQRQRVAMGRAIVREPKVFCMDEPLSNLDAKLRVSTRGQIAGLQRRLGVTTLYVTHDQVEAMTMGDRVAVMLDGHLQQVASPDELYARPVNIFVAGFIGSPTITLLTSDVQNGRAKLGSLEVDLPRNIAATAGRGVVIGVRPEAWEVCGPDAPDAVRLRVGLVEALGSETFVYGAPQEDLAVADVPDPDHRADADADTDTSGTTTARSTTTPETQVAVRVGRNLRPAVGDTLTVRPVASELHYFDVDSGLRLEQ